MRVSGSGRVAGRTPIDIRTGLCHTRIDAGPRHTPYLRAVESDVLVEGDVLAQADQALEGDAFDGWRASSAKARWRALEGILPAALLLAVALGLLWLLVAPDSPDLAAQAYRTRLFEEVGFAVWDDNWYAGHNLPGYSLLYPWASQLLGMRLLGVVALLLSTWAFERIARAVYGARTRLAAICFALAACGDLWIGRLTFALGVAFALLAVLALVRGRAWWAMASAALCAASSPVAGLLLAFAGVTHMLHERRLRPGVVLLGAPLAVVVPLQLLFPEGGWQPYAASSLFATLGVTLAFICALPREERLLRLGGLLYVPVSLLSLIHAPMGSNVERYAVLLAGPLLLCGLARGGWGVSHARLALAATALCGILVWTLWGPVRQTVQVLDDPSTQASYYQPLRSFLATHAHGPMRIEVPFTKSHWDAAMLAPYVSLARGWERQLDKRYNEAIEADPLSPAVYRRWLERNAVSYVALSDVRLDGSSVGESALIRKGVPYLSEVMRSAHWRVFEVVHPTPMASPPATLEQLGHDSLTLRFSRAGTSLVRVRYTPYWTLMAGRGCVGQASEGWTAVSAARAGVLRIAARFSLARALGMDGGCS
jgi:hypothetical protein